MKMTSIMLDEEDFIEAKKLNINLSATFREFLKILLYGNSAVKMTLELLVEVKDFAKLARDNEKWRVFLAGRTKRIKNLTGSDIGIKQLEKLVLTELEKEAVNHDEDLC